MMTATTTTLTHRSALAEARRTYEALYRALIDGADEDERRRLDRVHARGIAALDEQRPIEGTLSGVAAEAFVAYMAAAAEGDNEAKFAWLKMLPRVVGDLSSAVGPDWVFEPQTRLYEALVIDTLRSFDLRAVLHAAQDVQVSYVVTRGGFTTNWQVRVVPTHAWFHPFVTRTTAAEPTPQPANKVQAAPALAA